MASIWYWTYGDFSPISHHLCAFPSSDPYHGFEFVNSTQGGQNSLIYGIPTNVTAENVPGGTNIYRVRYDGTQMQMVENVSETTGLGLGVHVTVNPKDAQSYFVTDGQKDIAACFAPKLLAGNGSDKRHLLVVVNTDKGLCGGLNSNLVKAAKAKARELQAQGKTVEFYLVGKKGRAPLKREFPTLIGAGFDTSTVKTPGFTEAEAIANELIAMFDAGQFDVAHLIYPTFKSALAQDPTVNQLIPVPAPTDAVVSDAVVDYEPGEEEILEELLPRYVRTQLFGALLEREASEQGASMTAMDNATRNAGELIQKLTIQYNRSRQAAITTELIEIIAGAEAL